MKLKQTAILLLLACGLSLPASAAGQDGYSSYYTNMPVQMAQASAPSIPDYRVSVKDFGAKGDGATLDTEAFTKAIAAVEAKGGGHVDVPAGVYLLGPIELRAISTCICRRTLHSTSRRMPVCTYRRKAPRAPEDASVQQSLPSSAQTSPLLEEALSTAWATTGDR